MCGHQPLGLRRCPAECAHHLSVSVPAPIHLQAPTHHRHKPHTLDGIEVLSQARTNHVGQRKVVSMCDTPEPVSVCADSPYELKGMHSHVHTHQVRMACRRRPPRYGHANAAWTLPSPGNESPHRVPLCFADGTVAKEVIHETEELLARAKSAGRNWHNVRDEKGRDVVTAMLMEEEVRHTHTYTYARTRTQSMLSSCAHSALISQECCCAYMGIGM